MKKNEKFWNENEKKWEIVAVRDSKIQNKNTLFQHYCSRLAISSFFICAVVAFFLRFLSFLIALKQPHCRQHDSWWSASGCGAGMVTASPLWWRRQQQRYLIGYWRCGKKQFSSSQILWCTHFGIPNWKNKNLINNQK